MKRLIIITLSLMFLAACQPKQTTVSLKETFQSPPESASPWVFWYWMRGAVTSEGITADLEAMKEAGIGGAYLMPIKAPTETSFIDDPKVQLTPEWWAMVKHAFSEADRLGLKLAIHVCDGFALAGGPWITPELSMQKVVWSDTIVEGGKPMQLQLPQPQMLENYYKDIALFAYPTPKGAIYSTNTIKPKVTTSNGSNASFLTDEVVCHKFSSNEPCWIQYTFDEPFLCRNIYVEAGISFQAVRLLVEVSNDGKNFNSLGRLATPRHGWQDWDEGYTFAIEPTTAKYFRFVFDPKGTEPGAEDLDNAKWKAKFKIKKLELSGEPKIGGIEGKNGSVWRIAEATGINKISDEVCVNPSDLINISDKLDSTGKLNWEAPEGEWTLLRIGHTSNGHTNYTGGGGLGLEVDKFNPDAVKFQYDQWCGKIIDTIGTELASNVLDIIHVDSWECASQNWSPVFADEFKKRRGYDLTAMLPVMTGIPVESAAASEKFLKDVRKTISELVIDNFYKVFSNEIKTDGCRFSAECIAPTMMSDGLLHYNVVDVPMGEFWLRSPTHDKPNDALDAVTGAHVYGKPLIQAEGFTELRMAWDEYPGMLKTLADRNYALGFNKFVFHVCAHNPWLDRKPGITLDPIGLFFQRNQTWWKPGKAWINYTKRCQALLQQGKPVADVAVFAGEEIPSRSVLPDRLVATLPGIFGADIVEKEKVRLVNKGQPRVEQPRHVFGSANISKAEDWVDPLNGYAYDSFNPDVLLNLASVKDHKIVLPGGGSYDVLVIPGKRRMNPNGNYMSGKVAQKILQLVQNGATVLFKEQPLPVSGDEQAEQALNQLFGQQQVGAGKVLVGVYMQPSFTELGVEPDFMAFYGSTKDRVKGMAWNHRKLSNGDIYFIGNQKDKELRVDVSLRTSGKLPEIFNPVTGEVFEAKTFKVEEGRTMLPLKLDANESVFIVFENDTYEIERNTGANWIEKHVVETLSQQWTLLFDPDLGGPVRPVKIEALKSWTDFDNDSIKYYSGTATYEKSFNWEGDTTTRVWLDLGKVDNIASVSVNGRSCGVAWTAPYQVEITKALNTGKNHLQIEVTNTWANRLIRDHDLPEEEQITWTTAPYMLDGKPLLSAGLLGNVMILVEEDR